MSRKGTSLDYLDKMRADVYEKYKYVVSKGVLSEKEAFAKTQIMPSKRFWVSSEQAYKVCMAIRKGNDKIFEHMPDYRVQMFKDIYQRFLEQKDKVMFRGKKPYFIIPFIVAQPAPRFYISIDTIRKIVYQQRKKRVELWKKLARPF